VVRTARGYKVTFDEFYLDRDALWFKTDIRSLTRHTMEPGK